MDSEQKCERQSDANRFLLAASPDAPLGLEVCCPDASETILMALAIQWQLSSFPETRSCIPVTESGVSLRREKLLRQSIVPKFQQLVARPEGVEPPTFGFEVRRSIQLSYGRKAISEGDQAGLNR